MRWNVPLWVSIAVEFYTKYSALYENEENIKCRPKLPSPRNIIKVMTRNSLEHYEKLSYNFFSKNIISSLKPYNCVQIINIR